LVSPFFIEANADVREPGELQQEGKIPNAINLPLSSLQESLNLPDPAFREKFSFDKPEKNKVRRCGDDANEQEVIFYCKAGVRSTNASLIAKEAGYQKYGTTLVCRSQ
jgi:thiosulfate:glutathione sulfurtransferase